LNRVIKRLLNYVAADELKFSLPLVCAFAVSGISVLIILGKDGTSSC